MRCGCARGAKPNESAQKARFFTQRPTTLYLAGEGTAIARSLMQLRPLFLHLPPCYTGLQPQARQKAQTCDLSKPLIELIDG